MDVERWTRRDSLKHVSKGRSFPEAQEPEGISVLSLAICSDSEFEEKLGKRGHVEVLKDLVW